MRRFQILTHTFIFSLFILLIQTLALAENDITVLPVLPADLFSLEGVPDPCPHNESTMPKRYMIFWNDAPAIDGSFILVIHPNQMFLRSSHNNPNPDRIYWLSDISIWQYKALIAFLGQYDGEVLSDKKVWTWGGYKTFRLVKSKQSPDSTGEDWDDRCIKINRAIRENLSRIFSELNHGLPVDVEKFNAANIISITHSVFIIDDRAPIIKTIIK